MNERKETTGSPEELEVDLVDLLTPEQKENLDFHGVDTTYATLKEYELLEDPTDNYNSLKIKFKDLVNYTADSCDYFKYEVEDVLRHFIMVLRWLVIDQKKSVYVRGIGTFNEKVVKERIIYSPFAAKYYYIPQRVFLTLKTDKKILDHINPGAPKEVKTEVSEEELHTKYSYLFVEKEDEKQETLEKGVSWNETEAAADMYARKKKYLKAKYAKRYNDKAKRKAERDKALLEAQIAYVERKVQQRIDAGPKIEQE